jgi:hypothetical protein
MKRQQKLSTTLSLMVVLSGLPPVASAETESALEGQSDQLISSQLAPTPRPSKFALTPAQLDAVHGGQVMPYSGYRPSVEERYADALKQGENMMRVHICNMYGIC